MVRGLTFDSEHIEVEGQILGRKPTACALRLNSRDNRSRRFVSALLLGGDEKLGSISSLLVPSSHFRKGDKAILRLSNKQQSLRLQRVLLNTEEFTQYEVIQL